MAKEDWIWMPHPGHFIGASNCKFIMNTYVNGYIVSTVGEYFPDAEVRRIHLQGKIDMPPMGIDGNGKFYRDTSNTELYKSILELKGDSFDDAYLKFIA